MDVKWISYFFFGLAALLHVGFFVLESFMIPKSDKYSEKEKIWAFNQGFYNLFLAAAMVIGLIYVRKLEIRMAGMMVSFAGFCMIIAGLVLIYSNRKMWKAAMVQILPPLIGFIFLGFHIASHFKS